MIKLLTLIPYCLHRTKYEAIAQLLYSIDKNTEVIEFGSLPHPSIKCVSASQMA